MWDRLMINEKYHLVIMQISIAHLKYLQLGYRPLLPFFLSNVGSAFDIVFLLPL